VSVPDHQLHRFMLKSVEHRCCSRRRCRRKSPSRYLILPNPLTDETDMPIDIVHDKLLPRRVSHPRSVNTPPPPPQPLSSLLEQEQLIFCLDTSQRSSTTTPHQCSSTDGRYRWDCGTQQDRKITSGSTLIRPLPSAAPPQLRPRWISLGASQRRQPLMLV